MEVIRKATPPPGLFSRRGFLTGVGATLVSTALAPLAVSRHASAQNLGDDPFTLGIASGDPTPDGDFVRNVPPDFIQLDAEPVATEFIGTSITSGGDRTLTTVFGGNANNPHLRFTDNHHGYVRCQVTRDLFRTDYRVVPSVIQPDDGGISTLATFVVEQGQAGAVQA